jgi:hypothetical protein
MDEISIFELKWTDTVVDGVIDMCETWDVGRFINTRADVELLLYCADLRGKDMYTWSFDFTKALVANKGMTSDLERYRDAIRSANDD